MKVNGVEKEKISKVNHVLINGIPVVENGKIIAESQNNFCPQHYQECCEYNSEEYNSDY